MQQGNNAFDIRQIQELSLSNLDAKISTTTNTIENILSKSHKIVCSTKFGTHSSVFLHLITTIEPDVPVVWVDTGYNHQETLNFAEKISDVLNLNLHAVKPVNHSGELPPDIDDPNHKAFVDRVKLAPFRTALKALSATHWISSVRSYQTTTRKSLPVALKLSDQLTKVHPMLEWSSADMEEYLARYSLPKGPEVNDPTKGHIKRECGLHKPHTFNTD